MVELLADFDIPLNPWTGYIENPRSGGPGEITIEIPFPNAVKIDYVIACPSAPIWPEFIGYVYLNSFWSYYHMVVGFVPYPAAKKFVVTPTFESQTVHGSGCFLTYKIEKPNPPCGTLNFKIYGTNLDLLLGD